MIEGKQSMRRANPQYVSAVRRVQVKSTRFKFMAPKLHEETRAVVDCRFAAWCGVDDAGFKPFPRRILTRLRRRTS